MYIKSVESHGLGGVQEKTIISGFNAFINVIPATNASGKSSFMNLISFVLGLTSSSVSDGVTVTFDNSDKKKSKANYKERDEVSAERIVGVNGRDKYSINLVKARPSEVKQLFTSDLVNENSSSFLVTRDTIMKILNMHPLEKLSLLEEAAVDKPMATSLEGYLDTLQQKNEKLKELKKLTFKHEILKKLHAEKESYNEWKEEIERLTELSVAYEYNGAKGAEDKVKTALTNANDSTGYVIAQEREKNREISIAKKEASELATQIEIVDAEVVRLSTSVTNANANIKKDKRKLKKIADKLTAKKSEVAQAKDILKELTKATKILEMADVEAGKKKFNDLQLELERAVNLLKDLTSSHASTITNLPTKDVPIALKQFYTAGVLKYEECKGRVLSLQMDLTTADRENTWLQNEKDNLERELEPTRVQLATVSNQLDSLKKELAELTSQEKLLNHSMESWKKEIQNSNTHLVKESRKLNKILHQSNLLHKRVGILQTELTELIVSRSHSEKNEINLVSEWKNCRSKVEALVRKHPWIRDKEALFGQVRGAFDFGLHCADTASERCRQLRDDKTWKGNAVNTQVLEVLEQNENNVKNRNTIQGEIATINEHIKGLQLRKKSIVEDAFKKLCKSFAEISKIMLVKGSLTYDGGSIASDGFELRLSGNNPVSGLPKFKFLAGLAFVLALLHLTKAPYIVLDEIDECFDASDTRLIHSTFSKTFDGSQIFVVSRDVSKWGAE